jgi:Flp pilus assembly pilin Flp
MVRWLHNFWLDEQGQDLTEYSMLIAFIVVLCLAFAFTGTSSVSGIWTQTNSRLVAANSVTGGS